MRSVSIFIIMTFLIGGISLGQQPAETQSIDTIVDVTGNFSLQLSPLAVTFGNLKAGDDETVAVLVRTISNLGVNWQVTFSATELDSGTFTIPNECVYAVFYPGPGASGLTTYTESGGAGGNPKNLPTSPDVLYTSASHENGAFDHQLNMMLIVPASPPPDDGTYRNTITFTMSEIE